MLKSLVQIVSMSGMSALGQKQTCAAHQAMSALPPIADMCDAKRDVRFVAKADIDSVVETSRERRLNCGNWYVQFRISTLGWYQRRPTGSPILESSGSSLACFAISRQVSNST
jgi:hypothetical protein